MSTYINGWMSTFTPDMVLLLAGANDLIMGAGPTTALNRLGTLLDQIHAARPSARILVGTWWYPRTGSDNPKFKPAEIQVYNAGVANLVNARAGLGWSIQRVDTGSRIDSASYSQDYGMDGLHLSPAGYKKVGDAWYSAITGR